VANCQSTIDECRGGQGTAWRCVDRELGAEGDGSGTEMWWVVPRMIP
jgi:hypothetical protein